MTPKELDYVRACIDNEGFDYCFAHYSNFGGEAGDEGPESLVTDPEFHRLRAEFLNARTALMTFLGVDE